MKTVRWNFIFVALSLLFLFSASATFADSGVLWSTPAGGWASLSRGNGFYMLNVAARGGSQFTAVSETDRFRDAAIQKTQQSGIAWTKKISLSGEARAVVADGSGNSYGIGWEWHNDGHAWGFIAKLDSAGNTIWSKTNPLRESLNGGGQRFPCDTSVNAGSFSHCADSYLFDAALDEANNALYIVGLGRENQSSPREGTGLLIKMSMVDGSIEWRKYNSSKSYFSAVDVKAGSVYVLGENNSSASAVLLTYDTNGNQTQSAPISFASAPSGYSTRGLKVSSTNEVFLINSGSLAKHDMNSGSVLWRKSLGYQDLALSQSGLLYASRVDSDSICTFEPSAFTFVEHIDKSSGAILGSASIGNANGSRVAVDGENIITAIGTSGPSAGGGPGSLAIYGVNPSAPTSNPPLAHAQIGFSPPSVGDTISVYQNISYPIFFSGSLSSDPDGWGTAQIGVSSGGKCEWDTTFDGAFDTTINNPSSPSACVAGPVSHAFNFPPQTKSFFIFKVTDAAGRVGVDCRVDVTILPTPDLVGQPPITNTPAGIPLPGVSVTFSAKVANRGTGTATTTFSNIFEIDQGRNGSVDTTLPANSLSNLEAGSDADVTSSSWTAMRGNHRIRVCADTPGSAIPESNETNNCSSWQDFVADAVPDLIISQRPAIHSGTLTAGSVMKFKATIKNVGNTPAESSFTSQFKVNVGSLSPHPITDSLAVNQEEEIVSGSWTATPGTHTISVCADAPTGVVTEAFENNNCNTAAQNLIIVIPTPPDLIVSVAPSVNSGASAGGAQEGDSLRFRATVKNQGTTLAGAFANSFHINIGNDGNAGNDISISPDPLIASLGVNLSQQIISGTWNAVQGTHRIVACADSENAVTESVENNNCNDSTGAVGGGIITIRPPQPECSNGRDDDGDGLLDMADPGCTSPTDNNEDDEFTLTVSKSGPGAVPSLVRTPGRSIDCGTKCEESFLAGTGITLTATPASGFDFDRWSGPVCSGSTSPTCSFSMNANRSVTAHFKNEVVVPNHTLTVAVAGPGSGTVASSGGSINCDSGGSLCSVTVPDGRTVTLTASPSAGSQFGGWTNCASASGNICDVTVSANITVTAQFNIAPPSLNPDLTITALRSTPSTIIASQRTAFAATVQNIGSVSAPASVLSFRVDINNDNHLPGGSNNDTSAIFQPPTRPVSALAAGALDTVSSTWFNPIVGTHRIIVCANSTGVFTESNESNNCTDGLGGITSSLGLVQVRDGGDINPI